MSFLLSALLGIPGLVDKLLGYLQKRADVSKAGIEADTQLNLELVRARMEEQKLVAASRAADRGSLWTAWMLPFGVFLPCAIHFWAITLDSVPLFGHVVGSWRVPALPKPFDEYEGQIILATVGVLGATKVVGKIFAR